MMPSSHIKWATYKYRGIAYLNTFCVPQNSSNISKVLLSAHL